MHTQHGTGETMRPNFNEYFMRVASVVATRSTCLDKQVGCVLVDQDMHIIGCGYNGAPSKATHCTDLGSCAKELGEPCRAQHAEINALRHSTGRPVRCYCTLEPCEGCAKMLRNAGVEAVYFYGKTSKSGKEVFGKHWEQLVAPSEPSGKFDGILDKIRKYHLHLGYPIMGPNNRDTAVISAFQKNQHNVLTLAAIKEMTEVLDAVNWKPWKKYEGSPRVDYDNLLEEIGDVIFFLDSIMMNFGLNHDDLAEAMLKKLTVVNNRLTNGYHN